MPPNDAGTVLHGCLLRPPRSPPSRSNKLRLFKLPTGADEPAVMLLPDLQRVLLQAAAKLGPPATAATVNPDHDHAGPPRPPQQQGGCRQADEDECVEVQVARFFFERVVGQHADISITHARLSQLLLQPPPHAGQQAATPGAGATAAGSGCSGSGSTQFQLPVEKQISVLINMGALVRHHLVDDLLVMCVPGAGPLVRAIVAGRKEVLAWIRRRKYSEVAEKELLGKGKCGVKTPLGLPFHVADLLGQGRLLKIPSCVGSMLKVVASKGRG